ncbi:MAG: Stk1 family PASTA domain-containing Ser/Thr kinase [Mycobacteriales bacterium]
MTTSLADPLLGTLLEGRYRIEARIARGGMATVYRGLDERLDRVVAIKVMLPGLAEESDFLDRFTREAKAAARLSSGHVVNVYDQGSHNGLVYLVMELVAGRTLRDVLAERVRLTPAEAISVLEPVLLALAAAHRAGLVHRDVKPENVLLGDDGSVKVADFGLARAVEAASMTHTKGVLIGTVAYLAPEQVSHGGADERTDVYAAGLMLFEMLTGTVPYAGESAVSVAYRHVHEDVPPPSHQVDVPPALDALTVRATRRDPGARPADAGAFLAELRHVRDDLGLSMVPIPTARSGASTQKTVAVALPPAEEPGARHAGHRRRRRVPVALLVVLLLGLFAAGGGWWIGAGRFTKAPSLIGKSLADAEATVKKAGLSVRLGPKAYSEVIPTGAVVAQDPAATDRIRKGTAITLTISLGKERYKVPDLKGTKQADAEAKLKAAKLTPSVQKSYNDSVPAGTVISQSPTAGTSVRPHTSVTMVVSNGPVPVDVPSVVGLKLDKAQERIIGAGLQVQVTRVFDETVAKDRVISQSPTQGKLPKGSDVKLTVSNGPPLVTVPDVRGMKVDKAQAVLKDAGFKVSVVNFFNGDTVFGQQPGGGNKAPKGSTVRILH